MKSNVHRWASVGNEWRCYCPATGFVTVGKTPGEALAAFEALWNNQGEYQLIEGAPTSYEQPFVTRANALAACHQRWSQRLRLNARDGLVDAIQCAAALDELYRLATK